MFRYKKLKTNYYCKAISVKCKKYTTFYFCVLDYLHFR